MESPEELEATLAGALSVDEVTHRHRALRQWENSIRSRETIRTALQLYDDMQSLTGDIPATVGTEEPELG